MRRFPIALVFLSACATRTDGSLDGERTGADLQAEADTDAPETEDDSESSGREQQTVDSDSDDVDTDEPWIAPTVNVSSGSEQISIDASTDPWIVTVTHGFGIGGAVLNKGTAWPELVEFRFEEFHGLEGFSATASPEGAGETVIDGAGYVQGQVDYNGGRFEIVETLHIVLDDEVMLESVDHIDVSWVDFYR